MSKPHVSFDIPIKPILVQPVKISIPPNTFQQHLPKMLFQLEVGEMEIHEMPASINVQNLCIMGWTIIEKEQLIELLKKFKDIFAWTYKDLKGILVNIAQHWIELDTLIPLAHQARYWLNPNYATIVK